MERLIGAAVVGLVYCFFIFPIPALVISVIGIVCYIIYINMRKQAHSSEEEMIRQIALASAQIYLSPYTDIWKNLKLSNKNCSLSLGADGVTIKCREKFGNYRTFRIVSSKVHN